jgi:hypothetical protein
MDIHEIFDDKISSVIRGKQVWSGINTNIQYTTYDALVIMPEEEQNCHHTTLLFINEAVKFHHLKRLFIVYSDNKHISEADRLGISFTGIVLNNNDILDLISYIALFDCGEHIYISSLSLPIGRDAHKPCIEGAFTEESYVALAILRLPFIPKMTGGKTNG